LNETLDIGALHESLDDVRQSLTEWQTWVVRHDRRLIGSVRGKLEGTVWEIGRLMVAPDLAGRGLGRWLLRFTEEQAPNSVTSFALFTGKRSTRNIAIYERAGFTLSMGLVSPDAVRLEKPRR
jgi:GNAT superfamily N-acetyltransferase